MHVKIIALNNEITNYSLASINEQAHNIHTVNNDCTTTNKRVTQMSKKNETVNAFVASLNARHAAETINKADKNALRFINDATLTVSIENVFALMTECKVSATFAQDKRVSTKEMCMKAIKRVDNILLFATSRTDKLISCVEEVLRTIVLHSNARATLTMQDLKDCLNANVKIADAKKALIFQSTNKDFKSFDRHAQMIERACSALNIFKLVNKELVIDHDNAILKLTAKRFEVVA